VELLATDFRNPEWNASELLVDVGSPASTASI
jgi:hypothetical protein